MTQKPPPWWARLLPHIEITRQPGSWTLHIRYKVPPFSFRRILAMWLIVDLILLAGWILQSVDATPTHPFDRAAALLTLACFAYAQGVSIRIAHSERAAALRRDAEPPERAPTV